MKNLTRLAIVLLASAAGAQDDAFYPAVDLPFASGFLLQPYPENNADPQPGTAFDASHFTPSTDDFVRDLDGDGVLDGTLLVHGVWSWLGEGDGRFGTGTYYPTDVFSTSDVIGQWADMNADGRLDGLFVSFDEVEVIYDQGDGTFLASGPQPLPGNNDFNFNSWTVGFVNGDAHPDVVARNGSGYPGTHVDVLYGQGGTAFDAPVPAFFPQGFCWEIGLGDLNGDGLTDIAAHYELSGHRLRTYIQHPGGTFAGLDIVGASTYPDKLEVRDMTGDGLADVVSHEYGKIVIRAGAGDGSIAAPGMVLPHGGFRALFVDVDQDGLVDVLSSGPGAPHGPTVLFARPDGSLSPPVTTRHRADIVGTGDIDGDGLLDVFSPQVALLGRPDGSFEAPRSFDVGTHPVHQRQVALDDFNADGVLDVVATADTAQELFVTVSDVAATWKPPQNLGTTKKLAAVASGDLDGDGLPDVIAARTLGDLAELWLGRADGNFLLQPPVPMGSVFGNTGLGVGRFDLGAPADLVASGNGVLTVRLGQGGLVFGALVQTPLPPGAGVTWLIVRDLDGDAFDDVLAVTPAIYVYRSIGHGLFEPPVLAVAGASSHVSFADVDGDGNEDLLTSQLSTVTAHLGDGTGGFEPAPSAPLTSDRTVLGTATADVNDDGLLDLALGHDRGWSLHLGLSGGGWDPVRTDIFDLSGSGLVLRFDDVNEDGAPDLMAFGHDADGLGLTVALHNRGVWQDAGFALPGADGPPFLWPTGSLQPDEPLGLVLRDALPAATWHLVIGLAELSLPFKGGVLVPAPQLLFPGPPTSLQGVASLGATWPAGVPAGTELWMQGWIQDAAGPAGFSASNGVVGTTP